MDTFSVHEKHIPTARRIGYVVNGMPTGTIHDVDNFGKFVLMCWMKVGGANRAIALFLKYVKA